METEVKLTKLAECAGCGAKVGAGTLAALLDGFRTRTDENLLVGYDRSDDACVYRMNDGQAIIQTVDFFPPPADDPYLYGQIAAANALSDIYAMGGTPKLALNIMCVPETMADGTVREILRGGYDKVYEAGAVIAGGHTIRGPQPLYGLSVTGFARPDRILKNCGARPGDALILTKRLGVGILTTARKADAVSDGTADRVYAQMAALNRAAAETAARFTVHACTDVTGFGLLGHGLEMARGSECSLHIDTSALPVFEEAPACAADGFIPAGAYRNRRFAEKDVRADETVARETLDLCYDPQTSGGLLIAVPGEEAGDFLASVRGGAPDARVIGYAAEKGDAYIYLR